MKTKVVEGLGTVNLDEVEATSGQIVTFIPIKVVNDDLKEMFEKLENDFFQKHPEAGDDINFTVHVVYSFGGWMNAEFELDVDVWDDADESIMENYDEIKVNLSENAAREVKRIVWEGLGKALFNL